MSSRRAPILATRRSCRRNVGLPTVGKQSISDRRRFAYSKERSRKQKRCSGMGRSEFLKFLISQTERKPLRKPWLGHLQNWLSGRGNWETEGSGSGQLSRRQFV